MRTRRRRWPAHSQSRTRTMATACSNFLASLHGDARPVPPLEALAVDRLHGNGSSRRDARERHGWTGDSYLLRLRLRWRAVGDDVAHDARLRARLPRERCDPVGELVDRQL